MNTDRFNQALKQGDCDVVDAMLAKGYIPKPHSINIVCENGNLTLLQTLLRPEKYDMDIQSGLFEAVQFKHTHLLDHLYLAGANVNLPDNTGNTPLHYAVDPETCKWLLDMGAQQMPNHIGMTPLYRACINENINIVNLLLSTEQGVQSIAVLNFNEYTPLYKTCVWGNVEIVQKLLTYQSGIQAISMCDRSKYTPLYMACRYRRTEVVKLLLSYEQGVQTINYPNYRGVSPLTDPDIHPEIKTLLQNAAF